MLAPRQPQTTLAPAGTPPSTQTSLVFNPTATENPNQLPPPLTGSGSLTTHIITESAPPTTQSPVSSETPSSASSGGSTTSNIPTGAVIGAVLGSLAFLSIVISLILWHSRRHNSKPTGGDIHKTRNWERRKSKRETWSPLDDEGPSDMKPTSYPTGYPPLASTYLREKQHQSETPQLPLPPVSPLPFSTKFDLSKSPSPSPLPPDPVPHPYTNRALGLHPPTSPGFQPLAKQAPPSQLQLQPEYHSFTHPYATATPLHRHFSTSPRGESSLLPDADDQSFYSMDSPALNGSLAAQQQTVASTTRDSLMPEQTGNRSHNHNPFFTAHPSSHDGPEKWGSVGKARTVAPVELHMHKPSNSSSAMENLIAALSLGPSPAPSVHNNAGIPLNRSHHGHLGSSLHHSVPSPSTSPSPSPSENENPFEFDEVYGQDIAFSAAEPSPNSRGRESAGNLSTGTSTSLDGPSPGLFPMPPR